MQSPVLRQRMVREKSAYGGAVEETLRKVCHAIILRSCYAISLCAYFAISLRACYAISLRACYAISPRTCGAEADTGIAYHAIALRACRTLCGSGIAHHRILPAPVFRQRMLLPTARRRCTTMCYQ
eukprot:3939552-Rhodomonas_salina.4